MSDTEMLDWLERNATVNFSFENAEITFAVPDEFEGANSIREIITAAMEKQDE